MKQISLGNSGLFAQVDDEDFAYLNEYKWALFKSGNHLYARRQIRMKKKIGVQKRKSIFLHRDIMFVCSESKLVVDHKNNNGLDNRKENLRVCLNKHNLRNRAPNKNKKYKGVRILNGKIYSIVQHERKHYKSGPYLSEKDAAESYNKQAKELFGEYARLNIIKED